jgi:hypothetical protein
MKSKNALLSVALIAAFSVAPALAQNDEIGKINRAAGNQNQQQVLDRLSSELGVSAETLRQQKQRDNLSYGQLFMANSLASSSGKSVNTIVSEFRSGKGWGQIARENNVSVGQIVSNARRAEGELKLDHTNALDKEKRNKVEIKERRENLKAHQKQERVQQKSREKAERAALKSQRKS